MTPYGDKVGLIGIIQLILTMTAILILLMLGYRESWVLWWLLISLGFAVGTNL